MPLIHKGSVLEEVKETIRGTGWLRFTWKTAIEMVVLVLCHLWWEFSYCMLKVPLHPHQPISHMAWSWNLLSFVEFRYKFDVLLCCDH